MVRGPGFNGGGELILSYCKHLLIFSTTKYPRVKLSALYGRSRKNDKIQYFRSVVLE